MNWDTQVPSSIKILFFLGLTLWTINSCRHDPTNELIVKTPTQPVVATKVMYLGIFGARPSRVDTVMIQGKIYESAAFDSTTFAYDQQNRLVRLNLIQTYSTGSNYPGEEAKTTHNLRQTDYVYRINKLLIRTGFPSQTNPPTEALLDTNQRRIASRSWYDPASFTTAHDTLQQYSNEGLLISGERILIRSSFPRQTIRQLSLVESGNIVQTSTAFVETSQAFETTKYEYDLNHKGPLSTTTMFGENSRNALLRAITVRHEPGSTSTSSYEYTYSNEYDPKGRLIRQTKYSQSPGVAQREVKTLTKFYYQ